MKPYELRGALQRSGLAPLYLISGDEAYLRDEAAATVRAAAFGSSNLAHTSEGDGLKVSEGDVFNCDVLYGDETDAAEILAYTQEVPFFTPRRLIIVKWAEKLSGQDGEALIPYFQTPNETTTLVFVGAKFDGRLKWVQILKKQAALVDCSPLYENQRVGWIKQQAKQLGVRLDESALHLLKEVAAEGLYMARAELDKLASYLPPDRQAGLHDVEAIRGIEPGASVFDLAGAIGSGDQGRALRIVAKNLEVGEAPLRILGALVWQVRRIWKAKDLVAAGKNETQVARALGIPPFRAAEFFRHMHRWTPQQLRMGYELFWEIDSALKGGAATLPSLLLDTLILSLCALGERTSQERGPELNRSIHSQQQRGTTAGSRRQGIKSY